MVYQLKICARDLETNMGMYKPKSELSAFTASPHSATKEFESRWAEQARPVVVSMFSASTSSRFKENSTEAPGPGAYQTSNNWEDASGAGVLTSKTDRFASRGALLTPTPAWPHSLLTLRA